MKKYIHLITLILISISFSLEAKTPDIWGYSQFDLNSYDLNKKLSNIEFRRINFFTNSELSSNTRFLTDMEYEHNTDLSSDTVLGAIKISEAYLEHSFQPEIIIRAGKFLTDFGLYNRIHDASPSFLPVDAPEMYKKQDFASNGSNSNPQRLFGKYMAGVEFLGTINCDSNSGSQIDYTLGVGFGRWETVKGVYNNKNLSYAARVKYRPSIIEGLQVGTSLFSEESELGLLTKGEQYLTSLGFDAQYEKSNFIFQFEGMFSNFKSEDQTNQTSGVFYCLFGYTFFDKLTPYTVLSTVFKDFDKKKDNRNLAIFGINYNVGKDIFLKAEIQKIDHEYISDTITGTLYRLSLAVAF